jgi:lipoprotein-anchoring transpeptidase ErfK/SrfK
MRRRLLRVRSVPSRAVGDRPGSSGCIRMRGMDAIDLYGRVHVGAPAVVIR